MELMTAAGGVAYQSVGTDTSVALPTSVTLSPDTEYLWRVTATLENGTTVSSPAQRIRVAGR
jgi:hypothetical protein